MAKDMNGTTIELGDVVFFKCDIEQYGEVALIRRNFNHDEVVLRSLDYDGFDGEYIGGQIETTQLASDVEVNNL